MIQVGDWVVARNTGDNMYHPTINRLGFTQAFQVRRLLDGMLYIRHDNEQIEAEGMFIHRFNRVLNMSSDIEEQTHPNWRTNMKIKEMYSRRDNHA